MLGPDWKLYLILFCLYAFISFIKPKINLIILYFFISFTGYIANTFGRFLIAAIVSIFMCILAFRLLYNKKARIINHYPIDAILLIYFLHSVIYYTLARYSIFGNSESTELFGLYTFLPIIMYFLCFNAIRQKLLSDKFIIFTIMLSLLTVFFCTFIIELFSSNQSFDEFGPQFLGINSNNFGALYSGMLIFFMIYNYKKLKEIKIMTIITMFCLFAAVLLSQSRAALISFAITYVMFIMREKKLSILIFNACIFLIVCFIIIQFIPLEIFNKFRIAIEAYYEGNITLATSGRVNMLIGSLHYIYDGGLFRILFGGGVGGFRGVSTLYHGLIGLEVSVHNHFMHIFTTSGLIGLIIYLLMVIIICRDSFHFYSKFNDYFSGGVFFMMINFILCDMFGNRFVGISTYFVWPLIAILYYRRKKYEYV